MKRFIRKFAPALLLLSLNLAVAAPVFAQAQSGASIADIAQMQGPNRRQALIDGARKEGQLTIYAVNPGMAKNAAEFTRKYGIKVNLWRASSENVLQRVVTEGHAGRAQPVGQGLPFCHADDGAEMARRHGVAVDFAGGAVAAFFRRQVGHQLVAVEIEIDPVRRAAAFGAADHLAIKAPRFGDVLDGEGEVEQGAGLHDGWAVG